MSALLLLGTLSGCMMLADVSGGALVPLAEPEEAVVAVDLRYDPVALDASLASGDGTWEFPVVSGAGLRTKFGSGLSSFALGPEACIGGVRAHATVLPVLCGGTALVQLEWLNQDFMGGVGSPYLEPAVGFRLGQDGGALILSGQLEYMVRVGQPNRGYVGLQIGWGPWIWMHSQEAHDAVRECLGPCVSG